MGITKPQQLTGADRVKISRRYKQLYDAGHSIRAIAEQTGRSYTQVHKLLDEAGVTFRPRGGGLRRH